MSFGGFPTRNWIARGLLASGGLLLFVALAVTLLWADPRPILLQSLESRTNEDGPVFNRITWRSEQGHDLWVMQQSHHGVDAPEAQWDRLAIVVDTQSDMPLARFYQLAPGPLPTRFAQGAALTSSANLRPLRASCYLCHASGPRAIRPLTDARAPVRLGAWDQARLLLWNLRLRTYGALAADAAPLTPPGGAPFRLAGAFENETLQTRTCRRCHNGTARAELTRQNFLPISFMLDRGLMPPPGIRLSDEQHAEVEAFVRGLPSPQTLRPKQSTVAPAAVVTSPNRAKPQL